MPNLSAPVPPSQISRMVVQATTPMYFLPGWKWGNVAGATTTPTAHTIYFTPIYMSQPWAFDRISCEVTAGGGAGTLARLGLYTATVSTNGALTPGTLIVDAGTVDANSVAVADKTISQTLSGWYFTAFVTQAGTFRRPGGTQDMVGPGNLTTTTTSFTFTGGVENAQGSVLVTAQNIGADWPTNGLPATAPAITANGTHTAMFTQLRSSQGS